MSNSYPTPFHSPRPNLKRARGDTVGGNSKTGEVDTYDTPQPSSLKRIREQDVEENSDGDEGEDDRPAACQPSPHNEEPEHNNEEEESEGEDEIDNDIPVEMRIPNRNVLLGRPDNDCKRNTKKAKRSKNATSYVASGTGDVVQENLPASVLASSVSEGLLGETVRDGIDAISESISGGTFEVEANKIMQQDDLLSIVGRVNRSEKNSVVFKFTQLLNKLQLALKINR